MKSSIDKDTVMKIKELAKPIVLYLRENKIKEFYVECGILGIGFRDAIRIIKPEDMPPYSSEPPTLYCDEGFIPV